MSFTPKHSIAFRYWELSLAASKLSSADAFGLSEIWRNWDFEKLGDPLMHARPQCGYYKAKLKDGSWEPVAIQRSDYKGIPEMGDELVAVRGQHRTVVPAIDAWTYCGAHPICYSDYKIAYETGKFPGEISLPGPGHNLPQDARAEWVRTNIIEVTGKVDVAIRAISGEMSKTQADELANYRDALNALRKEAEEICKANRAPWLAAAKTESEIWEPLVRAADDTTMAIKVKLSPYMQKTGAKVGGQAGKRASLRSKWTAEITDYEAFAAYCCDHPKVREELQKCANAEARGNREEMPGVRYVESKIVV